MKKIIISLAISSLLVLMGLKNVNAQVNLETVTIRPNTTKTVVSEKVSNSFSQMFKDAKEPIWLEINKRFVVSFILNDQKNKAVFTQSGDLIYHLTYGTEKNVPDELRRRIQSTYGGYDISSAIKVKTTDQMLYLVNIENDKRILVIRAADDDISEIDRIKKIN